MGFRVRIWLGLWTRATPRSRTPADLIVAPFVSAAPMDAAMAWAPDWKTSAVGAILRNRPGALLDVGANVGQTLMDFLSAPVRSTYLGFEPNLICYQHLVKLVSDNALDGCRVLPVGLCDRNDVCELYRCSDVDSGTTLLSNAHPGLPKIAESASVFRLDDLAHHLPEPEIALIKIDVEGAELEVLRGMRKTVARTKPWILCEVLHRDPLAEPKPYRERCRELIKLLATMDYEILHVLQNEAATKVIGLAKVDRFPDRSWDDKVSPTGCDYLFVPQGQAAAAQQLFGG